MALPPPDQDFRHACLLAAVNRYGDVHALGQALEWKDGAFVRQMVNKTRPISEKTVQRIESLAGMDGWFQLPDTPIELTPAEVAMVLTFRKQLRAAVDRPIGARKLSGAKIVIGQNLRAVSRTDLSTKTEEK